MPDAFGNITPDDIADIKLSSLLEQASQANKRIGDPGGNIILNTLLDKQIESDKIKRSGGDLQNYTRGFLNVLAGEDMDSANSLVDYVSSQDPVQGFALAQMLAPIYQQKLKEQRAVEGVNKADILKNNVALDTSESQGITDESVNRDKAQSEMALPPGVSRVQGLPSQMDRNRRLSINNYDEWLGYKEGLEFKKLQSDIKYNDILTKDKSSELAKRNAALVAGSALLTLASQKKETYNITRDKILEHLKNPAQESFTTLLSPEYRDALVQLINNSSADNPITMQQVANIMVSYGENAWLTDLGATERMKIQAKAQVEASQNRARGVRLEPQSGSGNSGDTIDDELDFLLNMGKNDPDARNVIDRGTSVISNLGNK